MTARIEERARRALEAAKTPGSCDACNADFATTSRRVLPYGPSELHLCAECVERMRLVNRRRLDG